MKKKIIVIPVQKFEVYYEDCCNCLSYDDAKKYCKILGKGWRLPTQEEHLEMYKHKEELGLKDTLYWSGMEYNSSFAYYFNFHDCDSYIYGYKFITYSVRAVRTIK